MYSATVNVVVATSIRRTACATYEGDVRRHIIPGIGKRKLKTVQAAEIRADHHTSPTNC
jgi:hypothetical protein